ncbi:MAG TPA: hypothetical protein VFV52_00545, partial [Bacilli bacterium]|nr:hypothetical protein [Bacilli bacterium]
MKMIPLRECSEVHTLARPLYGPDQKILLNKGASIKPAYKSRLESLGIHGVYVEDDFIGTIEDIDPISDVSRLNAIGAVQKALDLTAQGKPLNTDDLIRAANKITDDLMS